MPGVVARNYNRKTVHVLYMDIVKSSLLDVEDMSDASEEMRAIADRVLEEVVPGWRNAGIIVQPSGDGMGLVFQEDPLHPAQVALGFLSRWPDGYNRVRVGINTGPVDVRDDLMTGLKTCQGDGIVAAQRVMALDSGGRIPATQEYVSQIAHFRDWSNRMSLVGPRSEKDHRMRVYELRQDTLPPLPADPDADEDRIRRLEARIDGLEVSESTLKEFVRRSLQGFSIVEAILSRPKGLRTSNLRDDLDEIMRPFVAGREALFPVAPGYVFDFAIYLDACAISRDNHEHGLEMVWRTHHTVLNAFADQPWIGAGLAHYAFASGKGAIVSDVPAHKGLLDLDHRTDGKYYQSLGIEVLHSGEPSVGIVVATSDRAGHILEIHDMLLELIAQCLGYYLTSKGFGARMQRRRLK